MGYINSLPYGQCGQTTGCQSHTLWIFWQWALIEPTFVVCFVCKRFLWPFSMLVHPYNHPSPKNIASESHLFAKNNSFGIGAVIVQAADIVSSTHWTSDRWFSACWLRQYKSIFSWYKTHSLLYNIYLLFLILLRKRPLWWTEYLHVSHGLLTNHKQYRFFLQEENFMYLCHHKHGPQNTLTARTVTMFCNNKQLT